jgi:hypothetical protein
MNNLQAAQEQWDGRTPMDDDDQIQIGDTTWDGEIELWADSIDWLNIDMVCHYQNGAMTHISVTDMYTGDRHTLPKSLYNCLFDSASLEYVDDMAAELYKAEMEAIGDDEDGY